MLMEVRKILPGKMKLSIAVEEIPMSIEILMPHLTIVILMPTFVFIPTRTFIMESDKSM